MYIPYIVRAISFFEIKKKLLKNQQYPIQKNKRGKLPITYIYDSEKTAVPKKIPLKVKLHARGVKCIVG